MSSSMRTPWWRTSRGAAAISIAVLVVAVLGSTLVGPGDFGVLDIVAVLRSRFGGPRASPGAMSILWELRFPRILLAAGVGAALGGAGAVCQGLFRNPLAEPGVLGISTGAAVAVVLGFVLGLDVGALWMTPLLAACGAAAVLAALFALSTGRENISVLLLTGVALSAVLSAAMSVLLSLTMAQWDLAQKSLGWLMGSFDGRGWMHVRWGGIPLLVSFVALWALHRPLDVLRLGEESAATLGVARSRVRALAAVAVALASGAATAMAGVIAFVGLVVPHIARAWVAPTYAAIIPASMALGAVLMIAVDTIVRALAPLHASPGALMSVVGGIFLVVLLRRHEEIAR